MLHSQKVIVLNGPPRCGKSTALSMLPTILNSSTAGMNTKAIELVSAPTLKLGVHKLLGLEGGIDAYEGVKDQPHKAFHGKTPREVYIKVFTEFLRPVLGEGIMGELWMQEFMKYKDSPSILNAKYILVSGLGCHAELVPLIKYFMGINIMILRIHREGYNFDNDCREYIYDTSCRGVDILNAGVGKSAFADELGWLLTREGFIE